MESGLPTAKINFVGMLDKLADDELRQIAARTRELLEGRKATRQKQALAEIRKLAKAHDLDISAKAKTGAKRRGRPPKSSKQTP